MTRAQRAKGFTLIELLIVIGIIAVLAAVLIPNLLKGKKSANEKAVISTMESITAAQAMYFSDRDGRFTFLDDLESGGYIGLGVSNKVMTAGKISGFQKSGYSWTFTLNSPPTRWSLAASPLNWDTDGSKHFYVNETGVIRYSAVQGTPAGSTSPPIE